MTCNNEHDVLNSRGPRVHFEYNLEKTVQLFSAISYFICSFVGYLFFVEERTTELLQLIFLYQTITVS